MLTERPSPLATLAPAATVIGRLGYGIGALAVVVFLVSLNVRLVATTPYLYQFGFGFYQIPLSTSLTLEQLMEASAQTRAYFQSDVEPLRVEIQSGGEPMLLYNEREIAHMADVKEIFRRIQRLEELSGGILLALLGIGLWTQKARYLRMWLRMLNTGALLTGVVVLTVAAAMLLAFEQLFLQFHLFSFTNDLWQLDPSKDMLIRMYPQGFFRDGGLAIGALSLLEAALLAGVSALLLTRLQELLMPRVVYVPMALTSEIAPDPAGQADNAAVSETPVELTEERPQRTPAD